MSVVVEVNPRMRMLECSKKSVKKSVLAPPIIGTATNACQLIHSAMAVMVSQIWTDQGIKHLASIGLPKEVEEGRAKRTEWLTEDMPSLVGVVEFR